MRLRSVDWKKGALSPWVGGLAAIALAVTMFALLGALGNPYRNALFDLYQRAKPRDLSGSQVRIVLVDDPSVAAIGHWPWPRFYTARLIEEIGRGNPRVIGLDMIFPEPDRNSPGNFTAMYPELDAAVKQRLEQLPELDGVLAGVINTQPVVLGFAGVDGDAPPPSAKLVSPFSAALPASTPGFPRQLRNLPEFEIAALGKGFLNANADLDGVFRKLVPAMRIEGSDTAAFSLQIANRYLGDRPIGLQIGNDNLKGLKVGKHSVALDGTGSIRPYLGHFPHSKVVSAIEVLQGQVPAGFFSGAAVVVAISATGQVDLVPTPLSPQTIGGMMQAQMTDAFLTDAAVLERPTWIGPVEWSLGISLALAAILLAPKIVSRLAIGLPLGAVGIAIVSSWLAFANASVLFDFVLPIGILGITVAVLVIARFIEIARARAHIHRAFDRYLSPELVERIARDPSQLELGGEERDMTVLFCDVRGFSALSEKMRPQQIIQFLVGLLTPMTDILLAGRATIDKYVGDAIIAFWNAPLDDPRHAQNAADSALAMITRLKELNAEMPGQNRYPWPGDVKIGIGLNAGPICVGNMGSERRLSYSMIGDTVNLASRIEGLTKYYGVEIAIGSELASRLGDYAIVALDEVRVVGRSSSETIYALVGRPDVALTREFEELRGAVDAARRAYRAQQWDEGEAMFAALSNGPFSKLASIHLDRIASYRVTPPPTGWDGVYQATEK